MNVLSLFDGMACGLVALKRAGIMVTNYYASEIDKYASAVAKINHPEIKHIGDVEKIEASALGKIDLILAGPPCQGFSCSGNRLDFNDPRSHLFFKAIEILWDIQKINPKVKFLIENVASMKNAIRSELDELIEIPSIKINSALVSAQNRDRIYWCNWTVDQPEDKKIILQDIIENGFTDRDKSLNIGANYYRTSNSNPDRYLRKSGQQIIFKCGIEKGRRLFDGKNLSRNFREGYRIYCENGKSATLTAQSKGGPGGYSGLYEIMNDIRKLTPIECERLQTLPDNYTEGVSNTQRYKMIGNGWTIDVIAHILSFI